MIFKKYFLSTLFGTLLSGIVGVFLAYRGYGVWALVFQYMTNTVVDTIILFITVDWRPTFLFSVKRAISLLKFGWKILFEGLSNTIATELQSLLIGKVYSSADFGFYTKGGQFPKLIVGNISSAISSVLFPAMSNEQDNKDRVLFLLRKSIRTSYYVVLPMLVGLAAVSRAFVQVLLTEKWLQCVPYLCLFCFTQSAIVGMIPRHQALKAIGRSDVYLCEHIVYRIIFLTVLLLTYRISVFAIALTSVIGSIIMTITVVYTSRKYNGYSIKDQIGDIYRIVLGCIIMGTPTYLIGFLGLPKLGLLVLQIFVGVIIYLLYSKIMKLEEYGFVKSYLMVVIKKIKGVH